VAARERTDGQLEEHVEEMDETRGEIQDLNESIKHQKKAVAELVLQLKLFESLDGDFKHVREVLNSNRNGHKKYQENKKSAGELGARNERVRKTGEKIEAKRKDLDGVMAEHKKAKGEYDSKEESKTASDFARLSGELSSAETQSATSESRIAEYEATVEEMKKRTTQIKAWAERKAQMQRFEQVLADIWNILRALGPKVAARLLAGISARGNRIFGKLQNEPGQLIWKKDYSVMLRRGDREISFKAMSGGEQMSAALAIQMAMARDFANSSFCIFDEPTVSLDKARRARLAQSIQETREEAGFTQVFVVSHDDAFHGYVDHELILQKDATEGTKCAF